MKNRTLFFGDNLEILRQKIADESFDLIYLDPPFNSNRNYNVLFKEGLQDSPAQVHAFEDSWHWSHESKENFDHLVTKTNQNISNLMLALEQTIGHNDMMAYLTMMTVRLIELHRVLKKTGSIYLHCDPTASHYLKIVMDVIFGKENFRNEIIWKRLTSSKSQSITFTKSHDVLLFYSKTDKYFFEKPYGEYNKDYVKNFYKYRDEKGRRYRLSDFTQQGQGPKRYFGEKYGWKEPPIGKHWIWSQEKIDEGSIKDLFYFSKSGSPSIKRYLDEKKGQPIDDIWTDIFNIQGSSAESLRYATQKPEALLERIIKASSKKGDWILDPFCGCGTTIAAAEKLKRNWVGIDITMLSINLVKHRLEKQFGLGVKQMNVDGVPADISGAKALFNKDPFEFEYWALDLVNAMPAQSKSKENMRGADKGIDGVIAFIKNVDKGNEEYGKIIVQIKGGKVQRNQIATLKGDVDREKADGGLFITLEKPTAPMKSEAVDAGSFSVHFSKEAFPKIQILTIEELLNEKKPNLPLGFSKNYFKEAKAIEEEERQTNKLDF